MGTIRWYFTFTTPRARRFPRNIKTNKMKSTSKKQTGSFSEESENSEGLKALFIAELKDMYWAEKSLCKAIPKLIKNAESEDLALALSGHLSETEGQVKRIESVFNMINMKAVTQKCEAMEGLIKEANTIMNETKKGPVRDAGIISAAQKIEHYEIASYGTLSSFAKLILGETNAVSLLEETLNEEKNADKKLKELAETTVNEEAVQDVA